MALAGGFASLADTAFNLLTTRRKRRQDEDDRARQRQQDEDDRDRDRQARRDDASYLDAEQRARNQADKIADEQRRRDAATAAATDEEDQFEKFAGSHLPDVAADLREAHQRQKFGATPITTPTPITVSNALGPQGRPGTSFRDPEDPTQERAFVPTYEKPDRPSSSSLTPNQEGLMTQRLTAEWDRAVQPIVEMKRASQLMTAGMNAARAGDLNAGSQAVLVTAQKMLDPNSVVRESEYARSPEGLALISRIQGAVQRLQQGGAGVPLPELEQFERFAGQALNTLAQGYIQDVRRRTQAKLSRYGIPDDLVLTDVPTFGTPAPAHQTPITPIGGTSPSSVIDRARARANQPPVTNASPIGAPPITAPRSAPPPGVDPRTTPPPEAIDALRALGPGRHTLDNGTVWDVGHDGSIRRIR